jgi:hypothetical protein
MIQIFMIIGIWLSGQSTVKSAREGAQVTADATTATPEQVEYG